MHSTFDVLWAVFITACTASLGVFLDLNPYAAIVAAALGVMSASICIDHWRKRES